ncbi:hypothetical protein GCM10023075_30080 [Streptosporangium album]
MLRMMFGIVGGTLCAAHLPKATLPVIPDGELSEGSPHAEVNRVRAPGKLRDHEAAEDSRRHPPPRPPRQNRLGPPASPLLKPQPAR